MRLSIILALTSLSVAACGGEDTKPDASVDIGFNLRTVSLTANTELATDTWMDPGPADLTCLNTPSADMATSVAVTLNAVVKAFQSGNAVPAASVEIFPNQNYQQPFGPAVVSDSMANLSLSIPVGT